jgi:hypothetical protein
MACERKGNRENERRIKIVQNFIGLDPHTYF